MRRALIWVNGTFAAMGAVFSLTALMDAPRLFTERTSPPATGPEFAFLVMFGLVWCVASAATAYLLVIDEQ